MRIARVAATVVATIQSEVFDERKLLVCDLLDAAGEPDGTSVIAVDLVGAGAGETVLVLDEGNSARQVTGLDAGPMRTVVIGIVDAIDDERAPHGRSGS